MSKHRLNALVIATCAGMLTGVSWAQQGDGAPKPAEAAAPSGPVQGQSSLEFSSLEFDFGQIIDVEPVETEFHFKNNGTEPLVISKMHASCGCTQPVANKPWVKSSESPNDQGEITYAPGESGVIKVSFKPQGKYGAKTERVTIDSNDPERPQLELQLHADVIQLVRMDPPVVNFGEIQVGQPTTQTFTVTGIGEDFAATYASVARGRVFNVKLLETLPVDQEGKKLMQSKFEVSYLGKGRKGSVQTVATVRTTDDRVPITSVQVVGEIVGELRVLPPRVNVGVIQPGEKFTRIVRLNTRSGRAFKILQTKQDSNLAGPMDIKITPMVEGQEDAWQLEISGVAGEQMQPITASLTLTTDVPDEESVVLDFSGAVRVAPRFEPPPIPERGPVGPDFPTADEPKPETPKTDDPK